MPRDFILAVGAPIAGDLHAIQDIEVCTVNAGHFHCRSLEQTRQVIVERSLCAEAGKFAAFLCSGSMNRSAWVPSGIVIVP